MVDEQREHRAKENIFAFLQRRSIEQRRSYLARGRRFVVLDVGQLSKSWITAVKNWLVCNHSVQIFGTIRRPVRPARDVMNTNVAERFVRELFH